MCLGKHSENLIRESLPDNVDSLEIEDDNLEQFDSGENSFGLGSGNKFVVAVLRQLYRNNGLVEAVVFSRRILVEYLCYRSRGVVVEFHPDTGAVLVPVAFEYPVFRMSELVGEVHAARQ